MSERSDSLKPVAAINPFASLINPSSVLEEINAKYGTDERRVCRPLDNPDIQYNSNLLEKQLEKPIIRADLVQQNRVKDDLPEAACVKRKSKNSKRIWKFFDRKRSRVEINRQRRQDFDSYISQLNVKNFPYN